MRYSRISLFNVNALRGHRGYREFNYGKHPQPFFNAICAHTFTNTLCCIRHNMGFEHYSWQVCERGSDSFDLDDTDWLQTCLCGNCLHVPDTLAERHRETTLKQTKKSGPVSPKI